MKHFTSPSLYFTLAVLALSGLSVGALASTTPVNPAATAATAAAQSSPSSGPIHYSLDETPLDRSNHTVLSSYSDMLDKVTPGVVGIYPSSKITPGAPTSTRPYRGRRGGGGGANPPQNQQQPDMTWTSADSTQYRILGVGSGVIISPDGYIVTNHHVVVDNNTPADGVLVKLSDGREFEGKVIGSDEPTDLALIKIDAKDLPVVKVADSEKVKVGDIVFAVGNPMDVGLTVTHGIVSATGRSKTDDPSAGAGYEDFIQTDAAINPGNSGGPLVDAEGRLVGLNAAIISSSPYGGSIGIGFAIPSALVRKVADDLIRDGRVRRGAMGVSFMDITHTIAEAWKLPNTHGAIITGLEPSSPATNSGLVPGDVVVKVNDDDVDSGNKFRYLVALADPGSTVNLTILHKEADPGAYTTKTVKVTLADRDKLYTNPNAVPATTITAPDNTPGRGAVTIPAPSRATRDPNDLLTGVSLMPLTDALRHDQGMPDNVTKGLVVTDVVRNSPFATLFGLGTVIISANQKPVTTLEELRAALKPGDINVFYVYRVPPGGGGGTLGFVTQNIPANP